MKTTIFCIIALFLWFLPVGLAQKRDRPMVFIITLFTAWTFVGWVVAMAFAVRPRGSAK